MIKYDYGDDNKSTSMVESSFIKYQVEKKEFEILLFLIDQK